MTCNFIKNTSLPTIETSISLHFTFEVHKLRFEITNGIMLFVAKHNNNEGTTVVSGNIDLISNI